MIALVHAVALPLIAGFVSLVFMLVLLSALIRRGRGWGVLLASLVMLVMTFSWFLLMGAGSASRSSVSTAHQTAINRATHPSHLEQLDHIFLKDMEASEELEQDRLSAFVESATASVDGEGTGDSGIVFASEGLDYNIHIEVPSAAPRVPRLGERIRAFARSPSQWPRQAWVGGSLARSLLVAIAIAAFLFIGYVVLDGSTRGQFTWPLRLASLVAFATIYFAVSALNS